MLSHFVGTVEPAWRDALQRAGLNELERLARGDVGQPFKRKADSCVHRLDLADAPPAYLKRYVAVPPRRALRDCTRGLRPATPATLEYQAVRLLHDHGFDVMEPIAHGERRIAGLWPREGFIMVAHVPGPAIDQRLRQADDTERHAILHALGAHLGRLHRAGFYHALRPRDLICRDGRIDRITMIDLDTKGWRPRLLPFD